MEQDNFKDPDNLNDIVNQIKNAQTIGTIYSIINNVFPNWILGFTRRYCPNYPHLTQNWHYICKQNNFIPAQVIIVSFINNFESKEHTLMNIFLDIFYKSGFSVRLSSNYKICPDCNNYVVPTINMYEKFVECNIETIPSTWTETCKKCNEENN